MSDAQGSVDLEAYTGLNDMPNEARRAAVEARQRTVSSSPTIERLQAQLAAQTAVVAEVRALLWPERDFVSHFSELCEHQIAVNDALGILARLDAADVPPASYQARVEPWMMACFGPMISADRVERHHRFLEEALELVQATGCTADEAHQLVEYVYGRPQGEVDQEVGGVMVTLAALCLAHGLDMHAAGETELARVWTKIEQIRNKQAAKPKYGPLPAVPAASTTREERG